MKVFMLVVLLIILPGCANRDIKIVRPPTPKVVKTSECLAAPIVDTSEILKPFVVVDTNKHRVAFKIPRTPVKVDISRQEQHSFYRLAERMSQDVIAMNNALLAMVLMRNMAPCDPVNIKMSWETMKLFIKSVGMHYDNKNSQQ